MAGFAGGIFASLFVTILSGILYPQIFSGPLYIMVLLGLTAGCTTILGDLVESGIKRSSGVKDSGSVIMGRGGLLDSIDSLLLTAPVFYYFMKLTVL
jgi:phosphatidate cytidylyltransferase